jgi:hypothetical protein
MRVPRGQVYVSSRLIRHCDPFRSISVSALPYFLVPGSVFPKNNITLDTAHPESTIDPITLQKWGKKLKNYYGWSEEVLLQHANLQF